MSRYTLSARIWIMMVATAATLVTAWQLLSFSLTSRDWVALGVIVVCGGIAHLFPIKSAVDGATYRMSNMFVLAAALMLPSALLTLVPVFALTPDSWLGRRRPGVIVRWTFNVAQTALAAHAAAAAVRWLGGPRIRGIVDLAALLVAAAIFIVLQAALVGVIIALNSRIPFRRTGVFAATPMLGESLKGVLAIAIAGLWFAQPFLLMLVPPLLFIAHKMTEGAHLGHLAQVDAKTGLHNYRHFERALADEISSSLRVKRPLAVLFADIDLLHQVNNRYGHLAGDRVLRHISDVMVEVLRKGDLVARFGGEEFVALLPGTTGVEAVSLAERVRAAISEQPTILDDGTELPCTISIGVATCPEDATTLEGLVEQADMAMYRAKRTRNAVSRGQAMPSVPRLKALHPGLTLAPPLPKSPAPPTAARAVLFGTIALGILAVGWGLASSQQTGSWLLVLPFVAVAVGSDLLEVGIYEHLKQKITFSFTVAATMAAVATLPVGAPVLVSLAAALTHIIRTKQHRWDKVLFNLANPALAAAVASWVFHALLPGGGGLNVWYLMASLAAVSAFDAVNAGIVSTMVSLHSGERLFGVIRETALHSPTKIFLGLTGAFLGAVYLQVGFLGAAVFAAPILILRYALTLYTTRTEGTVRQLEAAKTEVEQAHHEKEETLRNLIETVSSIIDARDNSVSGHSNQVARFAVALGQGVGLSPGELATLHAAGLLHDLGKVGVPEALLHKPGRLLADEYETVKRHALLGEEILAGVPQLGEVALIIGEHHERFDGTGYPRRKQGHEISIGGRILAVADALDSILADRPYAKGRSLQWALDEVVQCSGSQFDPHVVAALQSLYQKAGTRFFSRSTQPAEPACALSGMD